MPATDQPPRKGHGCWFYGCLSFAIILLMAVLVVILGTRYYVRRTIIRYSDTAPMSLPKVEASASQIKSIQERLEEFRKAIESGRRADELELDETAINLLIANAPELQQLADKVHIAIEGDQIKAQISLPLDRFPLISMPGRYLNGSAALKVTLKNGLPTVVLDSLELKGEKLPDHIMSALRGQNLARDFSNSPQTANILRRLESIEVNDGKIIIRAANPEAER